MATDGVRASLEVPTRDLRSVKKANGWSIGRRSRNQPVRCNRVALASIKIKDLDSKPGSLNDTVEQSLQSNLIDFGLEGVNMLSTVLVQRTGEERLVLLRVEFHPSAGE